MIIEGQKVDIRCDVKACNTIWKRYHAALSEMHGSDYQNSIILREGYTIGRLDEDLTRQVITEVSRAPLVQFKGNDATQDFAYTPGVEDCEDTLNAEHRYIAMTSELAWVFEDVFDSLRSTVHDAIRSPWRVLNLRLWKTLPANLAKEEFGPLAWHDDGMPEGNLKILVYLSDISTETGTVELINRRKENVRLQGPAGTWLLFQNSVLFHRGVAPRKAGVQRIVAEITISPSASYVLESVRGGMNARHPWRFWQTHLR